MLREGVTGSLSGLIRGSDYPDDAVWEAREGTVEFMLLVDERGKIADCTIMQTSGVAALDAQSCAIIKLRARLKPAIGLDGKPAKGSFRQRVTWKIE